MKYRKRILTVVSVSLLAGLLAAGFAVRIMGSEPPFTGEALIYYEALKNQGFPEDYAEKLTRIHLCYPEWKFEPVVVSRTWKDTVALETADPTTNLINGKDDYSAYRHKTNRTLYDSGYYQASTAAVSYFLDPRNFLNEADLFQFYAQTASNRIKPRDLEPILTGTFMENAVLENGKTYAEYIVEVGEEFGVDPIFLAVKLRQEQGTGTSPLLTGQCGTLLAKYYNEQTATTESGQQVNPPAVGTLNESDLTDLDGYYNLFNVRASGNGVFQIYRNALTYAKSHDWTTKWKALRGGAEFLKASYIGQDQSTVYLQKFDVLTTDGLHQYMQNVGGALSEGRLLYRFFAENGLTDRALTFQIPIYTDMPSACADPAKGKCLTYAAADTRYAYQIELSEPLAAKRTESAIFGSVEIAHNETLAISGNYSHDYDVQRLEYAWDGGEWQPLESTELSLLISPEQLPEWGEHLLTVRFCHTYDKSRFATHTLCAAISVTVVPPPSVTLTLQAGNSETTKHLYAGDRYTFPICEETNFAGYAGSDGTLYPSGYTLTLKENVTYTAVFLDLKISDGAALYVGDTNHATHLLFVAEVSARELDRLPVGSVSFSGTLFRNNIGNAAEVSHTRCSDGGQSVERITLRTPDLAKEQDLRDSFAVGFAIELRYTDGTERTVSASGQTRRSAVSVATAALCDADGAYSPNVRAYLQSLLN